MPGYRHHIKIFISAALPTVMLFFFTAISSSVKAQIIADTLQDVDVRSYKKQDVGSTESKLNNYGPGQKIITIDSSVLQHYQQQTLATMLARQLPVFVKAYGFNNSATLNFRGASAAQSQVIWEGVPLQNAASGIADVSLMPIFLMDEVHVVYGSSAALLGSGNVGGALVLSSKVPDFKKGDEESLSMGYGSFHQHIAALKAQLTQKKWSASLKLFGQSSKNDFNFRSSDGNAHKMINDSLGSISAMLRIDYKADAFNTISVQSWAQSYYRQIPPALFEAYSVKMQQDNALRIVADWKHDRRQHWYIKTAYLCDALKYQDSTIALQSNAITHHFFAEAGWEKNLSRDSRFLLFVPLQYMFLNEAENHHQLRTAIAGSFNHSFLQQKLDAALNARAEWIDDKAIFLPGLNGSYQAASWLKLQANVQRTYRNPTLNELYYNPGGNKDLKPEQGWHMDAGYTIQKKIGDHTFFEHSAAAYNRYIKDWIIWLGGAIWTPHNLASVHSRGLESENKLLVQTGSLQWRIGASGSYTRATATTSYITNDNSVGRQIPYTPVWSGVANAGLSWKNFDLNYNYSYTGYRYITSDESQVLQPYYTGNIQLGYSLKSQKTLWRIDVQCQNIADVQYEVVGFRPMPGRNWLFSLTGTRVNRKD